MGKKKSSITIRNFLNLFALTLIVLFFTLLFIYKGQLNNVASKAIMIQASPEITNLGAAYIDSLFNYQNNNSGYQITFLEFGSTGCVTCKRMEKVINEIQVKYSSTVNVVFLNITLLENHNLMKYYGISVIPTQVLLDRSGNEFFRHIGFYSTKNLSNQINKRIE